MFFIKKDIFGLFFFVILVKIHKYCNFIQKSFSIFSYEMIYVREAFCHHQRTEHQTNNILHTQDRIYEIMNLTLRPNNNMRNIFHIEY